MLVETLLICMLTNSAPYYDCSDQWTIQLYDDELVEGSSSDLMYIGFTDLLTKTVRLSEPNLSRTDHYGNNLLQHELKHAMCRCNWHSNEVVTFE